MKDFPRFQQPTEKPVIQRRYSGQDLQRSSIRFVLILLVLAAIAMAFVGQRVEYIRTERRVKALLLQKREVLSEIQPLKMEEAYLTQFSKIEAQAKEEFKLQEPTESQIRLVEMPGDKP